MELLIFGLDIESHVSNASLVFKKSSKLSSFFRIYSVDGIIYVLPLIYHNPLFVDVLHPLPHLVLDVVVGFIFYDELSELFLLSYSTGLLFPSPDRATCFIMSPVETLHLLHIHVACCPRHIAVESSLETRV